MKSTTEKPLSVILYFLLHKTKNEDKHTQLIHVKGDVDEMVSFARKTTREKNHTISQILNRNARR